MPAANSSNLSMTSSSGMGRSSAASRNAGTQRSVTVAIRPSAPMLILAAANRSGLSAAETVTSDPSAVTSSRASTWVAIPPRPAPVPCVPVEMAPEIVCASMSPRFGMARPSASRPALSWRRVVPDRTVTSPVCASAATIPVQLGQVDRHPVGGGGRGEGMTAAQRAHRKARLAGVKDGVRDRVRRSRPVAACRVGRCRTRPVLPGHRSPREA